MTKSLLFADLQLCEANAELVLGQVLPTIHALAVEKGCTQATCIGDFWEIRHRYPVWLLNRVVDFLKGSGLCWRLLQGNHDQVDRLGESALHVLGELPNVRVYDRPADDDGALWVPYDRKEAVLAVLQRMAAEVPHPETRVLYGHFGVLGASMGALVDLADGVPGEALTPFGKVFLGHYHRAQAVTPNAIYVGSPWQTSASEAGEQKYLVVLDDRTLEHTHYPLDVGPRYWKAAVGTRAELVEFLRQDGIREGDDVRVALEGSLTMEEASEVVRERGFRKVTVTPRVDAGAARLVVESQNPGAPDLEDYFRGLVAATDPAAGLDPGRLLSLFRETRDAARSAG